MDTGNVDAGNAALVGWDVLDSWLKDLYAPDLAPMVTKTPVLQHRLSQLYRIDNITREAKTLVSQIQSEATSEYVALSAQLLKILQPARLAPSDLPQPTAKALSELSQIAVDLGLSGTRIEAFERAVAAQTMSAFEQRQRIERARDQIRQVQLRIRASQERQRRLRKLLEARQSDAPIEEQKTREWLRNSAIVAQKNDEYRARLEQLEAASSTGHGRGGGELEYIKIKELDSSVDELQKAVDERKSTCAGYSALPPDIQLAYVKLEEARQTLEQLRTDCENAVAAAFTTTAKRA
ncbi:hypothetical protein IW140_003865 [Coemansia sp. RSA 1813]|nr:hypothetical protein EV178_004092 [Coemansia sp. RSA 1646]KAJ1770694.1 hypothetical protein LPJ74_002984 [Coemansia sp. RSA 1843]KAJ2087344.1 hypothetical protein IW138_005050 [Coemansia sp. RSA 986]KAJ2568437.1 hypothetical protein IW140_003865 [Coemansia sp. RSA 1813]